MSLRAAVVQALSQQTSLSVQQTLTAWPQANNGPRAEVVSLQTYPAYKENIALQFAG